MRTRNVMAPAHVRFTPAATASRTTKLFFMVDLVRPVAVNSSISPQAGTAVHCWFSDASVCSLSLGPHARVGAMGPPHEANRRVVARSHRRPGGRHPMPGRWLHDWRGA